MISVRMVFLSAAYTRDVLFLLYSVAVLHPHPGVSGQCRRKRNSKFASQVPERGLQLDRIHQAVRGKREKLCLQPLVLPLFSRTVYSPTLSKSARNESKDTPVFLTFTPPAPTSFGLTRLSLKQEVQPDRALWKVPNCPKATGRESTNV